MANAKKCDICGKFYTVPQSNGDVLAWDENINTNMIRVLRRKSETVSIKHDVMQFDACDECLQDVLDYMLSKSAESSVEEGKKLYLD